MSQLAGRGGRGRHTRMSHLKAASVLVLTALAVVGLRTEVVEPVRVAGVSMAPTLDKGQVVLVSKRDQEPERGDLITLRSPENGQLVVKRVIGLGGDVVDIRDAILFVNNVRVSEPYVDHETIDALYYGPVTVTIGSVLVMGDARASSIDSRTYGDVPLRDVTGTVVARLWPPGANPASG
jgi:signal peptidase I